MILISNGAPKKYLTTSPVEDNSRSLITAQVAAKLRVHLVKRISAVYTPCYCASEMLCPGCTRAQLKVNTCLQQQQQWRNPTPLPVCSSCRHREEIWRRIREEHRGMGARAQILGERPTPSLALGLPLVYRPHWTLRLQVG